MQQRAYTFNILLHPPAFAADVDECTFGVSICNATSEKCVNNIGNYICDCKDGFVNTSGMCKGRYTIGYLI